MHPLVWWTGFTVAGIWLQRLVPGVDFLAPGLVILMQERRVRSAVWMGLFWMFVIEGTSGLAFGTGILWYAALVGAFLAGRGVFESTNFLFITLIGLFLGVWHIALTELMVQLQDLAVPWHRLLLEGLLQAGFFPVQWGLTYSMYKNWVRYGSPI
ncbi:hypothetical protein GGQ74_001853 [Desulfobaculum xiamenense]|uniref:Rod shape-determining protein MreD n=1 Tax=Desulfobaculum xiamenense TaxID=995050 RepID=A0A846QMD0_9BACT|nr:hypothetical protein [Desulfobaculum xiamenense]NJB68180.1 hypothetical protein [Desulfobaculum xiamenense]